MFPIRPRRASTALTAAACAVVLVGLVASDASAGGRKWRGRGHRHSDTVVRVIERPVYRPRVSFSYFRPAPTWCRDTSYIVYDGNPYWYHVGLGAYFGGVNVALNVGNAPPRGYGYWDPECGEWVSNVRAYSTHCKRHHHRPALQVIRYHPDHSQSCDCWDHDHEGHWDDNGDYDDEYGDDDDDDDDEYDWR